MRALRHIRDMRVDDAVLLRVFAVEVAPVQTGVVLAVAVPGLEDVDFAVGGPVEGVLREHPVGGPDSFGAGG